jgi:DNA-binding NarL/FixJ family response regulator
LADGAEAQAVAFRGVRLAAPSARPLGPVEAISGRRSSESSRHLDERPTSVLLIDSDRAFSAALAQAIEREADLSCRGTSGTVAEATYAVETARPDIVLIDSVLPDGDGIDAIPRLRDRLPHARFVVMTGYADIDVLIRAVAVGATGLLPKGSPLGGVLVGIRAARDGRMLVDGSPLGAILGRSRAPATSRQHAAAIETGLTSREQAVLLLMREGLDPHAIAARLAISLHTCRGYQKSILAKLSAHSQLEAVVTAARLGIVEALDH